MLFLRRSLLRTKGLIVAAPLLIVSVPIGAPIVSHSTVPLGGLTFLTLTLIVTKPPQAVSLDWSPIAWPLGVLPAIAGPVRAALDELGACWQAGSPGAGTGITVRWK